MIDWLFGVDWRALFVPSAPILETFLRGTITYLAVLFLMRFILNRAAGGVSNADIMLMLFLTSAAQNAIVGETTTITDGLILVLTIILWTFVLDWAGFKSRRLQSILNPAPLLLVKDGKVLWRNLKRELITEEELMAFMRVEGVETLDQIKAMYMEGDGQISVQKYESNPSK